MMREHQTGYAVTPMVALDTQPAAILATEDGAARSPEADAMPVWRARTCWSRLRHAPWGRLAFDNDAWMFLLVLAFALVLLPLFDEFLPELALALLTVLIARAWLWCRAAQGEGEGEGEGEEARSRGGKSESASECNPGDKP